MITELNTVIDWFKCYDDNREHIIALMLLCHPNKINELNEARNELNYHTVFKLIQDCWLDVSPTLYESKGYSSIVTLLSNSIY